MALIIREATTDDLDDLAILLAEFTDLHARALPHIYQRVVSAPETADYLRRILASAQTRPFVADVHGQVVGLLILQRDQVPRTPVHIPRQWVFINVLVVREAYRRRGIGEALLQHAHAWAREHDIETVELMVAEFNAAAIAWYERRGYTLLERRMAKSLADTVPNTSLD